MEKNLRNFGFSEIKWTVKDFLSSSSREEWVISSPTFTINGRINTQWRFSLKDKYYVDQRHTVRVYLKSMNPSLKEPIWVTWKLFFPKDIGEDITRKVECDFIGSDSIGIELSDFDQLQTIMELKDEDKMKLKSMIFVSCKDSKVYKKSENSGLKALSQDLTALFKVHKSYDLNFLIGKVPVKAHRCILNSRSTVLKSIIARNEKVIEFPDLDDVAAKQIFKYLYTGNLDYVLRRPTFEILKWIKYLNLTHLLKYYEPDYVELMTEYKRKKGSMEFDIPLEKISYGGEIVCFPTSECGSSILERIFSLSFYVNGVTGEGDYMSIRIINMEDNFSNIHEVEVAVIDSDGDSRYFQNKICYDFYQEITFEAFLPKISLQNPSLIWCGSLHIVCHVYTSNTDEEILTTIKDDVFYYNIHPYPEEHYRMLSYDMVDLFETGPYKDFTLLCEGQKFSLHSAILSARSYIFRDLFKKNSAAKTRSFNVSNLKSKILRCVLLYMYSGLLLQYDIDDLIDIYKFAADKFRLLTLKYECCRLIEENFESLNISCVQSLALEYKDSKLFASVQKFISCQNIDNECIIE